MNAVIPDSTRLRQCWQAGGAAVGGWSVSADPLVAELVGSADLDVVCVDAQHGYADVATLPPVLSAMRVVGRMPLVRVRWNDPGQIMRALDAGASGVVVPMIDTAHDAAAAAQACRFPPHGIRSWGPLWSARPILQPTEADQQVLCVLMVETADAVANLDAIMATPGVDALYIGPNDLALSCGFGRATYRTDPAVAELLSSIIERAHAVDLPVGLHCSDVAMAAEWHDRGADWLTVLTDVDILAAGLTAAVGALRNH